MRRMILLLPFLLGADWPQWLGPTRDCRSPETIKPWGKDGLKTLWKQPVGAGHSSPIIVGGKVYLHTQDGKDEAECLRAFDAKSGEPLWKTSYKRGKFSSLFGNGPQATPAYHDGKVFTFGVTGLLTAFDAGKGGQVWQADTEKDLKAKRLYFGAACSPLVEDGKVVLSIGGKGTGVVAFDAAKGGVAWKSLDDGASYSSGIAVGKGEQRQLVFLTQDGVRGLSPKDGAKAWGYAFKDGLNEASVTPVASDGFLLASSIKGGAVGLAVDGKSATEKWKNKELTGYFSTPIILGKHAYLVTCKLSFLPESTLHCLDLETGKPTWSKAGAGTFHAAMLRTADDKLLLLSDFGELVLFQPDPKEYKELSRSRVTKVRSIWAHPALSGGRIYIRDDKELICLAAPE
ncbi:MAG: PQQ-binding-like beta-propeller repeat protein [Gemmataceae bacterium]|nr:PQQ-binding-like beta-propeller repeat protein [Gemmataceae bacterium]